MSNKESVRRRIARSVFLEAWSLKKRTILFSYSIGIALKICWQTVRSKMRFIYTKVRGTTYSNRQMLLQRLQSYDPNKIIMYLLREPENIFDSNAIKIIASIEDRGSAVIGYLSRNLASKFSPILDSGEIIIAILENITFCNGVYGCNLKLLCTKEKTASQAVYVG